MSTASETGRTKNREKKTATTGRVTTDIAISPLTPVRVMIWTNIPTQVKVPIKGRSCLTVFLDIVNICSFTGEVSTVIRAAKTKISGSPRIGKEWGKTLPIITKARKLRKGRSTRIQFIPFGASGSSFKAFSRSMDCPFHPRINIVNNARITQGIKRGRKKPTYGILTPAAVSIAQRLTGGAAALNPAMRKMMAAIFGFDNPI